MTDLADEALSLFLKRLQLRSNLSRAEQGAVTGLTSVHVNRMLQNLRTCGCISIKDHVVAMLDRQQLTRIAAFDPAYLG